ncbi:GAF domain-containing protein [Reyranella sp.]|uniref:GAF domain-containing protein n=1 Tax=Reyranella sp. TaxID=1929291 RepID=UPI003BA8EF68
MAYLFERAPHATPSGKAAASEPSATAAATPARRPKRLRPFWALTGFLLVVSLASAMAYYAYEGNRRLEFLLSGKLGDSERRLASQVRGYFNPAQQFLEIASVAAYGRSVTDGGWEIARLAELVLPRTPQVVAFTYVDPAGDYVRIVRNERGTMDTIWGNRSKGQIETTRRDAEGLQSTTSRPVDAYDPRTQSWYREAERTGQQVWTDAYILPPWGKARAATPGVTLAIPQFVKGDSRPRSVMALDVELASVSSILRDNEYVGPGGKALIIDGAGRIVAYPDPGWFPTGPDARAPLIDQVGDPILAYIYDQWRVAPFDRKIIDVGGGEHVVVAAQRMRRLTDNEWRVLSYTPTTESAGLSSQDILYGSIAALFLVAGISGSLAWRSVRADRRSAAALARQQTAELQVLSAADLVREASSQDSTDRALQSATEGAARACDAKRVAVWRLSADGRTLRCEDCFDRAVEGHTSGLELRHDELFELFSALATGAPIDAQGAEREPRTAGLFASYLSPLDIGRVYIQPLQSNGHLVGMLTVEDPPTGDSARGLAAYCEMLAILLAMRFTGVAPAAAPSPAVRTEAIRPAMPDAVAPDGLARRRTRVERTLFRQSGLLESLGDRVVDAAAVGVVRLPEWTTMVQRSGSAEAPTVMDTIMRDLHRIIESSGLDYAARLDDQMVVAALADGPDGAGEGALRVAQVMVELRDRFVELEEELGASLDFGLAVDVGMAMCSSDGGDPPGRHLWGGSVGVARVLAGTTARRGIAVSEPVYELLADAFLFRPRGSYFLPETGSMRTFVLVGQL